MTRRSVPASARLKARIGGVLYTAAVATGLVALSAHAATIARGDAAAALADILGSEPLLRLALAADLIEMAHLSLRGVLALAG